MTEHDVVSEQIEFWAIVELMGHRRMAGHLTEQEVAGVKMLRLEIPDRDGTLTTQFYGGAAVYCITPVAESTARAFAKRSAPSPVNRWEITALPRPSQHDMDLDDEEDDA